MGQILLWLSVLCMIKSIQTARGISPYSFCGMKGCYFDGVGYELGSQINVGCYIFKCIEYQWAYRGIDINCPTCSVSMDPHFHTFDSQHYDFHGLCNYSISQPIEDCCEVFPSYFPPYGIFASFKMCRPGVAGSSCLDLTTYKISDNISILIRHTYPVSLEINGDPLTVTSTPVSYYDCYSYTSVMVWSEGNCVYVVGNHYGIKACRNYLIIHTITKHLYQIAGLCGYYSGTKDDEYRLRDCSEETVGNEIIFAENWKTIDQSDKQCKECYSKPDIEVVECDEETAKAICYSVLEEARASCPSGYDDEFLISVIEDCIEDCCSPGGFEECKVWASVGFEFLCSLYEFEKSKIKSEE